MCDQQQHCELHLCLRPVAGSRLSIDLATGYIAPLVVLLALGTCPAAHRCAGFAVHNDQPHVQPAGSIHSIVDCGATNSSLHQRIIDAVRLPNDQRYGPAMPQQQSSGHK